MHVDVVLSEFIHPCSKKRRRAQCSIRVDAAVCVRALQMCVCVCVRVLQMCVCACASDVCTGNFSHSARLLLQQSRASYVLTSCLRAVLISSPDTWDWTRMHVLAVMHRQTLYENVDSAKIKVPFYMTDIDILRVASMHHTLYRYINPYRWIVTPLQRTLSVIDCFCLSAFAGGCSKEQEKW